MLLVRPPRRNAQDAGLPVPPLGLAYIAGALRAAGRDVEILDAIAQGWGWARFEAEVGRRRPAVVGLGTMTPVADVAYRAARIAKRAGATVVLGGPHATAVREDVFADCPEVDHLVIGEGEETVVPYLDWLRDGGPVPDGVLARGQAFTPRTIRQDIEEIVRPARDLLPRAGYRYLMATRPGFATLITSRGCPFRCSFCDKSISGSQWRARQAVDVVDELQELVAAGIGFVNIYDDNFTLHRRRVVQICEEILRRGLDIEWKCEGRVDGVDAELLMLMRRAGCRVVAYGVESGNAETLALLRKDVSIDRVRTAFAATRAAGIRPLAYIILGAPGETREQVRHTIDFVREIGADYVQFSSLVALPGTPLFDEYGRQPGADVRNPVDGDAHRHTVTDLPADELASLMRYAWRSFYMRPRPLARLARDAFASGAIEEAARLGLAMARWNLGGSPYQVERPRAQPGTS
ncbi:MAG: B12-binding domain-containing radical SAM protein [Proteobacteria bacterium]|nr:B12-binding domain-containing radical SAM protein [Pseudomonadota bacterium]